jgi:hypothetical protein
MRIFSPPSNSPPTRALCQRFIDQGSQQHQLLGIPLRCGDHHVVAG